MKSYAEVVKNQKTTLTPAQTSPIIKPNQSVVPQSNVGKSKVPYSPPRVVTPSPGMVTLTFAPKRAQRAQDKSE